jgi:hypothetical protein
MSSPGRSFRIVIQRLGDDRRSGYSITAYGDGISAKADFSSLSALLFVLDSAIPEVVLDLAPETSIVYAGDMELNDSQLMALGLAQDRN